MLQSDRAVAHNDHLCLKNGVPGRGLLRSGLPLSCSTLCRCKLCPERLCLHKRNPRGSPSATLEPSYHETCQDSQPQRLLMRVETAISRMHLGAACFGSRRQRRHPPRQALRGAGWAAGRRRRRLRMQAGCR